MPRRRDSAATQTQDVNDLLAKGVKGIAISPVDPLNETPFLNTIAGKTNLITSDSDAAKSNRLCYIGTDNHAAGVMAGGLIAKEALPQGGKIMLFVGKSGRPERQGPHLRHPGRPERHATVQIVAVRTDDTDHAARQEERRRRPGQHAGPSRRWSASGATTAPPSTAPSRTRARRARCKIICLRHRTPAPPMNGIKDGTI